LIARGGDDDHVRRGARIAAAALPRAQRDGFIRANAARLSATPTDGEVRQAIASALG